MTRLGPGRRPTQVKQRRRLLLSRSADALQRASLPLQHSARLAALWWPVAFLQKDHSLVDSVEKVRSAHHAGQVDVLEVFVAFHFVTLASNREIMSPCSRSVSATASMSPRHASTRLRENTGSASRSRDR